MFVFLTVKNRLCCFPVFLIMVKGFIVCANVANHIDAECVRCLQGFGMCKRIFLLDVKSHTVVDLVAASVRKSNTSALQHVIHIYGRHVAISGGCSNLGAALQSDKHRTNT